MNINLTLLGIIIALLLLLCSLLELVVMYQKKAYNLLISIIIVFVLSYFVDIIFLGVLALKVVFYYRYWSDKTVKKLFFIQLILVLIIFAILAGLTMITSHL